MYFRGLHDRYTGFTSKTYMQIITHLYTTYGIFIDINIMESEKRMYAPYDPSVAIELYFDQIKDAVELSTAAIPHSRQCRLQPKISSNFF